MMKGKNKYRYFQSRELFSIAEKAANTKIILTFRNYILHQWNIR